jgi:hypothetical protein
MNWEEQLQTRHNFEPTAVYVILRTDRSRFKIGHAIDPLARAMKLPEYEKGELDLISSMARWLPFRTRAEQLERSLHKTFAPFRAHPRHTKDGHTEWFDGAVQPLALSLLSTLPTGNSWKPSAHLQPLLEFSGEKLAKEYPLHSHPAQGLDLFAIRINGPLDAWYAVQDLWLRVAACSRVSVECVSEHFQVVLHEFRNSKSERLAKLRSTVMDTSVYNWRLENACGSFLRTLEYRNEDLVCELPSLRTIAGWPESNDLVWQVEELMRRLPAIRSIGKPQRR